MMGKMMIVCGGTAGRAQFYDDVYLLDTGMLIAEGWQQEYLRGSFICFTNISCILFFVIFVFAEQLMWYKLTIEGDSKPLARASHSCCAVGASRR